MTFHHDDPGTSADDWRAHPGWAQMPPLTAPPGVRRLVVVAAHPDDETLGAGALIRHAEESGWAIHCIVATLGEGSHPRSPTHRPQALADLRRVELDRALARLAPSATREVLGLPDGEVRLHEGEVADAISAAIGSHGEDTVLVAPWRRDGHTDHESAGRAAAHTAQRTGATLWEYPIWAWHWLDPADAPWPLMRSRQLMARSAGSDHAGQRPGGESERAAQQAALAEHASQIRPLSDQPGDEALLGPGFLAHFAGDEEVFLVEHGAASREGLRAPFERLHRADEDPWGVHTTFYEQRKRDLLLASLPRAHWGRILEVGCSVGALTARLAERADQVTALDASPAALERARRHLTEVLPSGIPPVDLRQAEVPADWPTGEWDLIVLSEVGYFLHPLELDEVTRRARESLRAGGVLLACHWRHPMEDWPLDGDDVHAILARHAATPGERPWARILGHVEDDFLLDLYADPAYPSPAAVEGLV